MMIKTHDAQQAGEYQPTAIDARKDAADFRLINVSPNIIRWKDGKQETVTKRQLDKLQAAHSWMADF
jgi:hypothetical protein